MENFGKFMVLILTIIVTIFVTSWYVQMGWNMVMPKLFGLSVLNYWQAACFGTFLTLLSKIDNTKKEKKEEDCIDIIATTINALRLRGAILFILWILHFQLI